MNEREVVREQTRVDDRLPLEYALLGLLWSHPMHGYELHKAFDEQLGYCWSAGRSQLYAFLKSLDGAGLVTSTLEMHEGRPPRRVMELTEKGRQAFIEWLRRPVTKVRQMRVELPIKLYFFSSLGLEGAGELLKEQEAICRRHAGRLEREKARATNNGILINELAADYRWRQVGAALDWIETCRERIK